MDKKDLKILYELDNNARISLSDLSKKLHMSKQNLNYRLNQLENKEIIKKYTSIINLHKLGLLSYRVYIRYLKADEKTREKIINYFKKRPEIIWFVSLSGSWDLEVVFGARNFIHLNKILKETKREIGKFIAKTEISMSIVNYHFYRDYLINKKRTEFTERHYGFEPENIKLDDLDKNLIKELTNNCRQNTNQIGEKLKVSYHTIQNRMKNLEKSEIIQGYRILFDFNKLNREYHKILIQLNNPSEADIKDIYNFISSHDFVVYIVEVLGIWNLEIECEVENSNQIDKLILELRNKFPSNILDYDTIKVLEEHKLNYFPVE